MLILTSPIDDDILRSVIQSAATGLLGLLCLYLGIFLYEDEQSQAHNYLEEAWVRLDDKRQESATGLLTLLKRSARLAELLLDRLVGMSDSGADLVSACIVAPWLFASANLPFYIADIMAIFHNDYYYDSTKLMYSSLQVCLSTAWFVSGLIAVRLIPSKRSGLKKVVAAMVLCLLFHNQVMRCLLGLAAVMDYILYLGTSLTSLALLISILITRRIIEIVPKSTSVAKCALLMIVDAGLSCLLMVAPIVYYDQIVVLQNGIEALLTQFGVDVSLTGPGFLWALISMSTSGAIALLPTVLWLMSASVGLIHVTTWNLLLRPIYALDRTGVLKNRRALVGSGVMLMGFSLSDSFKPIGDLLKALF